MGASERRWGTPIRVVGLQVAVTLLVAAAALAWGVDAAWSSLLGGIAAFVPNAYFAWAASRAGHPADGQAGEQDQAVREAGRLLARWVVKIMLAVALLVVALTVVGAGGLGFFVGLGAALMAPLLGGRLAAKTE